MIFDDLGLSEPLLRAVKEQGYNSPTPIQAKAIPLVRDGQDIMAAAQTGTGKTAGFTLPMLYRLATGSPAKARKARALVLTPTRELAAQVAASVETYGKYLNLRSAVVFGGVKINPQIAKLNKGVDILIATPGRLLDLYQQKAVSFEDLEILVLDEADRMLDMGFIHDIRRIVKALPKQRQTLMFSATFSKQIRDLATNFLINPKQVDVAPPNATADRVDQWVYPVDKKRKSALLTHLVKDNGWDQVLIFTRTKHGANKLCKQLDQAGIRSAAIHGNKSQNARTEALARFKGGKIKALVATDIAARGIDIEQLPQVVNFDLPNVAEDYVHRIGRTGRAGSAGQAHSLVSADEADNLFGIERLIRKNLPQQEVEGFEPEHSLPERRAPRPAKKANNGRAPSNGNGRRSGGGGGGNNGNGNRRGRGGNARPSNGNGNSNGNRRNSRSGAGAS
ncbi:MAG: DEAD/DEAH box helicase [Halioglobus sp.]